MELLDNWGDLDWVRREEAPIGLGSFRLPQRDMEALVVKVIRNQGRRESKARKKAPTKYCHESGCNQRASGGGYCPAHLKLREKGGEYGH